MPASFHLLGFWNAIRHLQPGHETHDVNTDYFKLKRVA